MPINFIANDPMAPGATARVIDPTPQRVQGKVDFDISGLPKEDVYPTTSMDFVAWQAREAALRALSIFETIAGALVGWTGSSRKTKLSLRPNDGQDLNAYYNRASVSFFEFPLGKSTIFSGASTDVVSHEVGHAILDALRPDLWSVNMLEVGAFHEGFGDCIAIMTALSDADTRAEILKGDQQLQNANYVEATAEQLSAAIGKALTPNHNAAKPRHGLNSFIWAFPQSLPDDGKPGVLINEVHSFGQLASGCYYDLILEIFRAGPGSSAALWTACQTATRLLAEGVKAAPVKPRFLDSVGRAMLLADRSAGTNPDGSGIHEAHIKAAFARHGIQLSSSSMLAPRTVLAKGPRRKGAGAKSKRSAPSLATAVRDNLKSILDVETTAKLFTRSFPIGDQRESEVVSYREVDLSGLNAQLDDVTAYAPQVALVGPVDGATALLGAVDAFASLSSEVRDYVAMLVRRNQIDFKGTGKTRKSGSGFVSTEARPTHALRRRGGKLVLERVAFRCACHTG
ncbi:hypothetical protein AB9E06_21575 [Rhizobium leguminosarum]|uniref:hypothetical protein n=1 Tax=Rhizobium leguminosarum TaxID=384 RepID=UPI003F989F8A